MSPSPEPTRDSSRELANLQIAEPDHGVVVLEQDRRADLVGVARHVLELARRHAGGGFGTRDVIPQHQRVVEPVLDDLAADDEPRRFHSPTGLAAALVGGMTSYHAPVFCRSVNAITV